ncbi:MAG: hypothetical protein NT159_09295 [Proteobacteria bacterium]|nr:hypothetical protein [Pseudomonadota bacterium]
MRFVDEPNGTGSQGFDERKTVAFDAQSFSPGKQEIAGLAFEREPHPPFGAFEMDTACALKSQRLPVGKLDDHVPK